MTIMKKKNRVAYRLMPLLAIVLLLAGCGWGGELGDGRTNDSLWPSADDNGKAAIPENLLASDGEFTDKVGIKWDLIESATGYRLYRSATPDGEYTELAGINNPPDNGDTGEDAGKAVFTSSVDLNKANIFGYRGVFITGGQVCKIAIHLGDSVLAVAVFSGKTFGHYFRQDEVITIINHAIRGAMGLDIDDPTVTPCTPVDGANGEKYIQITTTLGDILLENNNDPLLYVPLDHLFQDGVAQDETILVELQGGTTPVDGYYYRDINVTAGTHYYYKVRALYANGIESDLSQYNDGFALLNGATPAPVNVAATDGTFTDRAIITWDAVEGADYYHVYRKKKRQVEQSKDNIWYEEVETQVGGDITGTSCEDTTIPRGMCFYKVVPYKGGLEGVHSSYDAGYRTVSDLEFFWEFNESIKYSQCKVPSMGTFGDDIISGDVSGTCHYTCKWLTFMSKVQIVFNYTNYCDEYLVLNDPPDADPDIIECQHTIINDFINQGGDLLGKINVTGIYCGYIKYYIEVDNGEAAGGYYLVSQDGETETTVPWTEYATKDVGW